MTTNNNQFEIRPCNIKELCTVFKVSYKTMARWLKPHKEQIGPMRGKTYTALQVGLIIELIGLPKIIEDK